mmetsp:Transcript_12640/g.36302  ORF Transcript_12640/g.36302 Transcript_12640/m.36302 type:complete len:276 (+) Transcript_12640:2075-2902(+)
MISVRRPGAATAQWARSLAGPVRSSTAAPPPNPSRSSAELLRSLGRRRGPATSPFRAPRWGPRRSWCCRGGGGWGYSCPARREEGCLPAEPMATAARRTAPSRTLCWRRRPRREAPSRTCLERPPRWAPAARCSKATDRPGSHTAPERRLLGSAAWSRRTGRQRPASGGPPPRPSSPLGAMSDSQAPAGAMAAPAGTPPAERAAAAVAAAAVAAAAARPRRASLGSAARDPRRTCVRRRRWRSSRPLRSVTRGDRCPRRCPPPRSPPPWRLANRR